jgi:hypothetical protein
VSPRGPLDLTPSSRLLLLCARLELSPTQAESLRRLASTIDDWNEFVRAARRRMVAPLVLIHLSRHGHGTVPNAVLERLRRRAATIARRNLKLRLEQRSLAEQVFDPLGVRHLWFKGPSLAGRYYRDPAHRPCRDLDVLIEPDALGPVLSRLLELGYHPVNAEDAMHSPDEVGFVARFLPPPALWSPGGVVVEVETVLEKSGRRSDSRQLLSHADRMVIDGREIGVLPTARLFVYLCRHHTRHAWSRLHWLADLDAVMRDHEFDREAVLREARSQRVERTVEAAMELLELCGDPEFVDPRATGGPAGDLLRDVARMLRSTNDEERGEARQRGARGYGHRWQGGRFHRLKWAMEALTAPPRLDDYRRWPLPERWFWLYRILRPMGVLLRRRESAANGPVAKASPGTANFENAAGP